MTLDEAASFHKGRIPPRDVAVDLHQPARPVVRICLGWGPGDLPQWLLLSTHGAAPSPPS